MQNFLHRLQFALSENGEKREGKEEWEEGQGGKRNAYPRYGRWRRCWRNDTRAAGRARRPNARRGTFLHYPSSLTRFLQLDREREERNFFQLERDKIHTFWEITRRQLEERKAELRNKDREMEESEERHQVEIKGNSS